MYPSDVASFSPVYEEKFRQEVDRNRGVHVHFHNDVMRENDVTPSKVVEMMKTDVAKQIKMTSR